ncbi:ABC transporter substrate-binding protein [Suicoccus acidiformans]|uniref:ABC transporter substrate-binding protein n=1 Tax=Suicoccus acidiformans TaxID=2036206 RepID=A0A347WNF2_9LACT|nr:ABC transporter substrate-binding protein [Suicoccus acidiformans]AXY26609.1 ABC transporter substrate-binding protein [Suicoccus acidiformans]
MHKVTKLLASAALLVTSILTPLAAAEVEAEETLKVGILQYVEHESLNQTYEGFLAELEANGYVEGENLDVNYLNASADNANLQSMSETLTNSSDYLFAIATPAAQNLANIEKEKPIYFSAVTDAVGAKLVESNEAPGGNMTGTIDAGPIEEQVNLLINIVPEADRVGLIYNSGETNSLSEAEKAKAVFAEKGIEVVESTVTSTNDISQIVGALAKEDIDAIFTVTDNTIASAMTLVGDLAIEAGLPLIGGSTDMTRENGLATYGLDYYELGRQTARMLLRQIEEDLSPSEMPVETAENLELVVNEDVAEQLGIDPSSIQAP